MERSSRSSPGQVAVGKRAAPVELDVLEEGTSARGGARASGPAAQSVSSAAVDVKDDAVSAKRKKRSVDAHWVVHFLRRVPFDCAKLCGVSRKAVDNMDEFPNDMWECAVPDLHTGNVAHSDHMAITINDQNAIDHFRSAHAAIHTYMTDAADRGVNLELSAYACLKMLRRPDTQPPPLTQMMVRCDGQHDNVNNAALLRRERKEVALALWLLGTRTPPHRLQHTTWNNVQAEMGIGVNLAKELRRVHYPLIFEAITRLRREAFASAGFIHVEFDFLTVHNNNSNKSVLIVCGHTCVDFTLFSDILGIVECPDYGGNAHVAQLARDTVQRMAPNSIVMNTNTVDSVLLHRAGANAVDDDDDTQQWCICHQLVLPVKMSLSVELHPDSVVALDFHFMRQFGVYLQSRREVRQRLDAIRAKRLGEATLLSDCLAGWESEHRMIKRFVDLKMDLIALAESGDVAAQLAAMIDGKWAPVDALKPKFWARLDAMRTVIERLRVAVKSSQCATSVVTMSSIPFWLTRVDAVLLPHDDEPTLWPRGKRVCDV